MCFILFSISSGNHISPFPYDHILTSCLSFLSYRPQLTAFVQSPLIALLPPPSAPHQHLTRTCPISPGAVTPDDNTSTNPSNRPERVSSSPSEHVVNKNPLNTLSSSLCSPLTYLLPYISPHISSHILP